MHKHGSGVCERVFVVVPYIHVFIHHCGWYAAQTYHIGGMPGLWNQGVERMNGVLTQVYFRGTNRHKEGKVNYLVQMMKKQMRRLYAALQGWTPPT